MFRIRHIAIILPDTFQSIGIQSLLNEYFPPVEIVCFSSYETFTEKQSEPFNYYIITADTFVINADFFLPRRNKTIILTQTSGDSPATGCSYIRITDSREAILEQLQSLFTNEGANNTSGDNNKDLSLREIDVLQLIVKGITNKEIADKLSISLNTVLTHRKNITSKLGIKTVSGLTFYAIINGLISGDEIEL